MAGGVMRPNSSLSPKSEFNRDGQAIAVELDWLQSLVHGRISHFLEDQPKEFSPPAAPEIDFETALGRMLVINNFTLAERAVLALCIAPHIRPDLLEAFILRIRQPIKGLRSLAVAKCSRVAFSLPWQRPYS